MYLPPCTKFILLAFLLLTIYLIIPSPPQRTPPVRYPYSNGAEKESEQLDEHGERALPEVTLDDDYSDPKFEETVLFIGILSGPSNADRRQGIRESWLQYPYVLRKNVLYKFFLGHGKDEALNQKVREENEKYGDIYINDNIEESYFNITRKVRDIYFYLESFKGKVPYALKTDDDTFNNVRTWVDHLRKLEVGPTYTVGQLTTSSRPIRDSRSPWYASPEDYEGDKYPPFNFGAAYGFNYPIAKYLKEDYEGPHHVDIFKLEDVWSGIVGAHYEKDTGVKINRIQVPVNTGNGCRDGVYSQHYAKSPAEMKKIWSTSKNADKVKCK
eukprot:TRINITY_DN9731_c0_g1_i1.p1 TRINITY_DN9731_c0_g1~~TRINITY_DN9731_c0_g1_i1.p1  ORF type:complete len:339 (+),score=68.90 TRINITY_DN9731_c0_g1_i1:38-1018(+)